MDDDVFKHRQLKINPSIIFRIILIGLFLGEIFIFFYFFLSQDFSWKTWKSYVFVAVLLPVMIIFVTGIIVQSFHRFFYNETKKTPSNTENEFKPDHSNLFSQIPFLLKLLLLIIAIVICYCLNNIVFGTIVAVNFFVYILFASCLLLILMFMIYIAVCMIYNYKMDIKKLELYYLSKHTSTTKLDKAPVFKDIAPIEAKK